MNRYSQTIVLASLAIAWGCGQPETRLTSVASDEGIAILEDSAHVLFYQVKPKSLNGKFERASYIHPLYSLDGNVLTEDFPEDHLHHHGIFSAWHQIVVNDSLIGDGWTSKGISWEVTDVATTNQGDRITIQSEVLWKGEIDGRKEAVVKENLEIVVHESNDETRVVDYNYDLEPLKNSVRIGGSNDAKGYGGFSFRFKLPDDIRFVAGGGEVEARVEAVEAGPWMDFAGSFDGKAAPTGGILIFCHPSNPGSPERWILRKARSMQNAAFPGRTPVELPAEGLAFRYRMVIHKGGMGKNEIEKMYQEYSADK